MKHVLLLASFLAFAHTASAQVPLDPRQPFSVLTVLRLKPGTHQKFYQEVRKIVAFSRAEPGNLAWYVQQSVEDPSEIVFFTRWVDQAALDWHLNAGPVARYIERSNALLARPVRLLKYRPLDL